MPDTTVHIGENSPEKVALDLLQKVMSVEGKALTTDFGEVPDRKWLLDTYAECLLAVTVPEGRR